MSKASSHPELPTANKRKPYEPTLQIDFVLLGFLDEHRGRSIYQNGNKIEEIHQSEQCADKFESYLAKLIKEEKLDTTFEQETFENGWIYFYSQEITTLLNSFYGPIHEYERVVEYPNSELRHYTIREISHAIFKPITSVRFKPEEFDPRFSYLLGVYQRYGKENSVQFGNATHKTGLVNKLFQEVGCTYVTWTLRQDCAPALNKIEFTPTEELKNLFGLH